MRIQLLKMNLSLVLTILCLLLMTNHHQCESRHLPTRGQGDNLEKLRELMYQILESSNENQEEQRLNSNPNPNPNSYSSWSKQSLLDVGIPPQLLASSKSRYGRNNLDNNLRMY